MTFSHPHIRFPVQILLPCLLALLPFIRPVAPPPSPAQTTTYTPHTLLGARLLARVHALSEHTEPIPAHLRHKAVTRPFLSPASRSAQSLLQTYMQTAALATRIDAAGNVIGDLKCPRPHPPSRKTLALGSHHDTVTRGGIWDGSYGVLAAISVAHVISLRPGGVCALPFDIRVIAFDDEEGNSPFPTTNFGAKAYTGILDVDSIPDFPAFAHKYLDVYPESTPPPGVSAARFVADRIRAAQADPAQLLGFIELHIEQGPVLQTRARAVGIVNAIAGQTRFTLRIFGVSGHAGTVPMLGRRDALTAAAQIVLAVERVALMYAEHGLVATVGVLDVSPGSSNVIPGRVSLSVDVRAPDDSLRVRAVDQILAQVESVSEERRVRIVDEISHDIDAVAMTPWLTNVLEFEKVASRENSTAEEDVLNADGGCAGSGCRDEVVSLMSGAGHDTQYMSKITDVAMIFVRCKDGISHHPDEHVSDEDSFTGAHTLLRMVDATASRFRSLSPAA